MEADKAISDMKCWAVAVLILAILSGNLAIFITGIVGASMVLCCASSNEQVAKNASRFKCCTIACAIIGGLHALGALALGSVFAGAIGECTSKLQESSCTHLDGRRRLDSAPLGGVAAALSKGAIHAPLLLSLVTGGSGLLFPTSSLGAPTLAAPRRLAECGRSWGNYVLASSGAADCTGCGKSITSYEQCQEAAASGVDALEIGDLGGPETWDGPGGCHIQDRSNFQFNTNGVGCGRSAGHTPVCLLNVEEEEEAHDHGEGEAHDHDCEHADSHEDGGCDSLDDPDCDNDDTPCRDWGTDCCWGGLESEEQLACDPGYRPELLDEECFFGLGQSYECTPDEGYTTKSECEGHMEDLCARTFSGAIIVFFFWMFVELVGVTVYSISACKAAKVPQTYSPGQSGTQLQPTAVASAVAQPTACASAVAQPMPMAVATAVPVAGVPMATGTMVA